MAKELTFENGSARDAEGDRARDADEDGGDDDAE